MTKRLTFRRAVESGRYWFHLHTTATDGRVTIGEYIARAKAGGIRSLVFLEHIRRQPSYDPAEFASAVRSECARADLQALVGFETKLLADGSLDIRAEDLERADVIGVAEHGWEPGPEALERALRTCLARHAERWPACPLVWVHPGVSQPAFGNGEAGRPVYLGLLETVCRAGHWVERNLKYGVLDSEAARAVPETAIVVGRDSHSAEELLRAG